LEYNARVREAVTAMPANPTAHNHVSYNKHAKNETNNPTFKPMVNPIFDCRVIDHPHAVKTVSKISSHDCFENSCSIIVMKHSWKYISLIIPRISITKIDNRIHGRGYRKNRLAEKSIIECNVDTKKYLA
jgi:hypothetical protein